jgi:CubicO group peptidase (beta-lactamase class C family)
VIENELGALLAEHAERHSVPGAAIGVLRGGVVTTACYGTANVRTGEAVTAKTRFSIGSLTKSIVATVIAVLAHAGRLSLDDPVSAHVPELRGGGWADVATVRDLLANRSGLPLRAALEFGFAAHRDPDEGALARLVAEIGADLPPGATWSYTNVGWCVLGRVIETVTGDTWEVAMRHHLFDRAGMTNTTFATALEPVRRVVGYDITPGGPVAVEPLVARAYGPAGTSVVSTAADVLRFAALHLRDPSLAVLRAPHANVSIHGWFAAWCLGWAQFEWEGGGVWGWDGLLSGERSALRIVPEHDAAIVLLTNSSTGRALYRSLFAELMKPLFGIRFPSLRLDPSPGSAGDLTRFAGVYGWPDREVEVTTTARSLRIRTEEGETDALPIDDRVFLVDPLDPDNPTVTFGAFDDASRPMVLYEMLWGFPRLGPAEWPAVEGIRDPLVSCRPALGSLTARRRAAFV